MPAIVANVDSAAVLAQLDALAKSAGADVVLHQAGDTLLDLITLGFDDQVDPWGNAWAPLSQYSRNGQPLRDTGRLMASFAKEIDGNTLTVGTNVCYALPHQFGATVKAGQPAGQASLCGYQTTGAKRLAWSAGGSIHFAKSTTIPARAFLPIHPGQQDGAGELPSIWETHVLADLETMIEAATNA